MLQEIPGAPLPAGNHDDHAYLAPLFLGPAGENEVFFEHALLTSLREHSRWRRARMNRFGRQLFSYFVVDPAKPDLQQPFVGSLTSLLRKNLSLAAARRVAQKLGLDPASIRPRS